MDLDAILNAADPGDLADAIMDLHDRLEARVSQSGLDLPPPARTLFLVLAADSAMNNEGPEPLAGKQLVAPAVEALQAIGAAQMAKILEAAAGESDATAQLDEWSLGASDLEALVVRWVSTHADTLRAL